MSIVTRLEREAKNGGAAVHLWHITAILFFTMGCATKGWEHPTNAMNSFERDHQQCAQQADEQARNMDPHTGQTTGPLIDDCLERKGYRQR